jgi:murein DD-endopeptidase MepM/ murein hydrolase activator NlpD
MQIILVHHRLSRAKSLTITPGHLALAASAFVLLVVGCVAVLYLLTFSHAADINVPIVRDLLLSANHGEAERKDKYLRENVNAMAVKLGEMQAQLMRLDALGDRVSGLAGLPQQEINNFRQPPARGGLAVADGHNLSADEFQAELDKLVVGIERRSDSMNILETELMSARLQSKMMPTIQPVDVGYNASGFGTRIDPFTGQQTMHEGIDFVTQAGTPIVAAAGGVVIASEWHHDFGNMIEIDHGNDISTLYAHSSRVYVKVGDIVRRGDHIADVGSTGRATGAHLHFEVHVKGVPNNPAKFLAYRGATLREQVAAMGMDSLPTARTRKR